MSGYVVKVYKYKNPFHKYTISVNETTFDDVIVIVCIDGLFICSDF